MKQSQYPTLLFDITVLIKNHEDRYDFQHIYNRKRNLRKELIEGFLEGGTKNVQLPFSLK